MSWVFGVAGLVAIVVVVIWLMGLPGDDDEPEEVRGFIAANWRRFRGGPDR